MPEPVASGKGIPEPLAPRERSRAKMAKLNVWKRMFPARTHEGAVAQHVDPRRELRRGVLTCLLWEDTFYEKGNDIAKRLAELVASNKPEDVAALVTRCSFAMF